VGLKITELTELAATPAITDILAIVDDPGGSPATKKITVANLHKAPVFTGAVTIPTINLTGGQIAFPATAVPSADPNTLDDYEEGTWTFDLQFGNAKVGITYNAAFTEGYYTKIGRLVTCTGFTILTSKGTSVGPATLSGLPFTVANDNRAYAASYPYYSGVSFANVPLMYAVKNSVYLDLQEITEVGVLTSLTDANFANDSQIMVSISYVGV